MSSSSSTTQSQQLYDAIVIGGSYAGLQAALTLGRSRRHVLVIDGGQPCNRFTPHSQNFLTQDGAAPADIAAVGRQQIETTYGDTVDFLDEDIVTSGTKMEASSSSSHTATKFEISTLTGKTFVTKKLVFATGVRDLFPADVTGFAECWGKSLIHCPYCHGYEFHSKRTALLAPAKIDMILHMLPLLRNLTENKLYLMSADSSEKSLSALSEEQMAKLKRNDIIMVPGNIQAIEHTNGFMAAVSFDNGDRLELDCMYAMIPNEQSCSVPHESFGCDLTVSEEGTPFPPGLIKVNPMTQASSVPGIYACGDATTPFRAVAVAVAGGTTAGAMLNMELAQEQFM